MIKVFRSNSDIVDPSKTDRQIDKKTLSEGDVPLNGVSIYK